MYYSLFVHPPIEGHLDSGQVLVTVSRAAMKYISCIGFACVDLGFQLIWVNT